MPSPRTIDLNADLGEGFGRYRLDDASLLEVITSANVACGFHAGDPTVMRETVRAAITHGVVIGAHPSYPDLQGFGRRELGATPAEIEADVVYQLGALQACCIAAGGRVRYVKPHGALYNRAARDAAAADAIARAVRSVDPSLALLGLAGSQLVLAAERAGIHALREGFVDRGYQRDGTLILRTEPGALIDDPAIAARRALQMVQEGTVEAVDGTTIALTVDSLCTHGDGPHALAIVRAVRQILLDAGVHISAAVADV
jgi:UPF0271 protein